MITAKAAKEMTNVENFISEKIEEIEEGIKLSAKIGLCYYRYHGSLPASIIEMLKHLGYNVELSESFLAGDKVVITWGESKEDLTCC